MLNDYALIIGVETYRAYDPTGNTDVAGAINDARALVRECLAMGFSPERIRVLTSPVLSAAGVGPGTEGIHFGEATRDQIAAGLTWIYGELSRPEPSAGLCTFSGHGAMLPDLVLCPSNFDGSAETLVQVAEVRRAFGDGKAAHDLTVLLDCCQAQGNAASTKNLAARLAALVPGLGGPGEIPERLLASARTDQTSVASRFGGVMMGAFTWATTSTLGQWKTTKEDGVARLDVSYGELRDRTQALLSALSFEQVPVLSGPLGVARLPFLHPGRRGAAGEATKDPNAPRPRRQVEPSGRTGGVATLGTTSATTRSASTAPNFCSICITDAAPITIGGHPSRDDTEYWYFDASMVMQLPSISQITFAEPTPLQPDQNYEPTPYPTVAPYIVDQLTQWRWTNRWNATGSGQSSVVFERTQGGSTVYVQFLRQGANQSEIAQMYWYQLGPQGSSGQKAALASIPIAGTFSALPSNLGLPTPPAGHSWYVSDATSIGQFAVQSACQNNGLVYLGVSSGSVWLTDTPTQWLFVPATTGSTTGCILLATNPSLALEAPSQNGAHPTLAAYSATDSTQQWTWTRGDFGHITNHNGMAIEDQDGHSKPGNYIICTSQPPDGQKRQQWKLA